MGTLLCCRAGRGTAVFAVALRTVCFIGYGLLREAAQEVVSWGGSFSAPLRCVRVRAWGQPSCRLYIRATALTCLWFNLALARV